MCFGGSKQTTTSTMQLPPEFQAAYSRSLQMAQDATSRPYEAYQGQLVAGLNPTQLQGLSNINAAQGMALPAIQQGMGYTQQAAQGITPELYNRFYSPYVQDVANATQRNLLESNAQQQSGLKSSAIQAGAFGGDRAGIAAAEMARQQNLANGQTMSGIYNQGYNQAMGLAGQQVQNLGAMGNQLAGLGLNAQGSALQGAQAQMQAGATQQATEQAQLQAAYDQFLQRLAYPYQQANFFSQIATGLGSTAGGTTTSTQPGPSAFSQILGGIGAVGSIFSDERVKENIEPVGSLNDGQTVYRYNYKGDPKTRIGLIAQEVEGRKPSAVTEIDGIKGVDYHSATDDAAAMENQGGLVPSSMMRSDYDKGGGVPAIPYGGVAGYVPEISFRASGNSIPGATPQPKEQGLGESWGDISPLSSDQIDGLKGLAGKVKGFLAKPDPVPSGLYGASIFDGFSKLATGGVARGNYATNGFVPPKPEEVDAFVAQTAKELNISPEDAVRLWRAEAGTADPNEGWQSNVVRKDGTRERSFSPLQLNMEGGVGQEMLEETGIDPSKPENWQPAVRYGLGVAKERGWHPWAAAKKIGLVPGGNANVIPASSEGLGAVSEPAPSEGRKGLGAPFASDDNPNLIERLMGRRMSPEVRSAILNASFALMAGRSPNFMTNLGEAGQVGARTYYAALKNKQDMAEKQAELDEKDREKQEKEERKAKLEEMVAQLPPEQQALARLYPEKFFDAQAKKTFGLDENPSAVKEYEYAKQNGFPGTFEDWKKIGNASSADLGLQPVPLVDKDGKFIGYGQMSKSGGLYYQGEAIDGVNVLPMDPAAVMRTKEIGRGEGKAIGEARGDLAGAEAQAQVAIQAIDDIASDPALDAALGWTSYLPDAAVTNDVIRVRSKARRLQGTAFLQARAILKGGGPITDYESMRAEQAYSRLETAIQSSNPEDYRDALADFKQAVIDGIEKIKAAAKLQQQASPDAPAGESASQPSATYEFDPATGELK